MIILIVSCIAIGLAIILCICKGGKETYRERAAFVRFAIQHSLTFASCCQLDAEIDLLQEEFYNDAPERVTALCIELYDIYHNRLEELQPKRSFFIG